MKTRNGFVSNSSSCSFAILLNELNSKDRDLLLDMEEWDIYIERRSFGLRFLVGFGNDFSKGFDLLPANIQTQMKYD